MASIAFPKNSKLTSVSAGIRYGYIHIAAQLSKPTLLFVHGYPSSSYHWHNQVAQCQSSGYGMIAPDLLGYGDTDKPSDFAAYDNTLIAKQLVEILDQESLSTVIGVGHDWGSTVLSTVARLYPTRFEKLIFLTVGYVATQGPTTDVNAIDEAVKKAIGRPIFAYWHFFNKPEAAGLLEAADPLSVASLLFPENPEIWKENLCEPGAAEAWIRNNKTTKVASWITREELAMHSKIMALGGFTGPLNYYKQGMAGVTHTSEEKINVEYARTRFSNPTLFVGCTKDVVCVPTLQEAQMKDCFDNLTVRSLDTGHWCMLEKPKELWEIIEGWIESSN